MLHRSNAERTLWMAGALFHLIKRLLGQVRQPAGCQFAS